MVCGKVAVGGVLRLLNAAADLRALGQFARGDGTQICFPDARIHSGACLFDSIGHNHYCSLTVILSRLRLAQAWSKSTTYSSSSTPPRSPSVER